MKEGDEAGLVATRDGAFEHDAKTGTESVTVSVPGMGLKKLTMNTSQMQEKSQAAGAVYELASALGSSFWVYAEVNFTLNSLHFVHGILFQPVNHHTCCFMIFHLYIRPVQMFFFLLYILNILRKSVLHLPQP